MNESAPTAAAAPKLKRQRFSDSAAAEEAPKDAEESPNDEMDIQNAPTAAPNQLKRQRISTSVSVAAEEAPKDAEESPNDEMDIQNDNENAAGSGDEVEEDVTPAPLSLGSDICPDPEVKTSVWFVSSDGQETFATHDVWNYYMTCIQALCKQKADKLKAAGIHLKRFIREVSVELEVDMKFTETPVYFANLMKQVSAATVTTGPKPEQVATFWNVVWETHVPRFKVNDEGPHGIKVCSVSFDIDKTSGTVAFRPSTWFGGGKSGRETFTTSMLQLAEAFEANVDKSEMGSQGLVAFAIPPSTTTIRNAERSEYELPDLQYHKPKDFLKALATEPDDIMTRDIMKVGASGAKLLILVCVDVTVQREHNCNQEEDNVASHEVHCGIDPGYSVCASFQNVVYSESRNGHDSDDRNRFTGKIVFDEFHKSPFDLAMSAESALKSQPQGHSQDIKSFQEFVRKDIVVVDRLRRTMQRYQKYAKLIEDDLYLNGSDDESVITKAVKLKLLTVCNQLVSRRKRDLIANAISRNKMWNTMVFGCAERIMALATKYNAQCIYIHCPSLPNNLARSKVYKRFALSSRVVSFPRMLERALRLLSQKEPTDVEVIVMDDVWEDYTSSTCPFCVTKEKSLGQVIKCSNPDCPALNEPTDRDKRGSGGILTGSIYRQMAEVKCEDEASSQQWGAFLDAIQTHFKFHHEYGRTVYERQKARRSRLGLNMSTSDSSKPTGVEADHSELNAVTGPGINSTNAKQEPFPSEWMGEDIHSMLTLDISDGLTNSIICEAKRRKFGFSLSRHSKWKEEMGKPRLVRVQKKKEKINEFERSERSEIEFVEQFDIEVCNCACHSMMLFALFAEQSRITKDPKAPAHLKFGGWISAVFEDGSDPTRCVERQFYTLKCARLTNQTRSSIELKDVLPISALCVKLAKSYVPLFGNGRRNDMTAESDVLTKLLELQPEKLEESKQHLYVLDAIVAFALWQVVDVKETVIGRKRKEMKNKKSNDQVGEILRRAADVDKALEKKMSSTLKSKEEKTTSANLKEMARQLFSFGELRQLVVQGEEQTIIDFVQKLQSRQSGFRVEKDDKPDSGDEFLAVMSDQDEELTDADDSDSADEDFRAAPASTSSRSGKGAENATRVNLRSSKIRVGATPAKRAPKRRARRGQGAAKISERKKKSSQKRKSKLTDDAGNANTSDERVLRSRKSKAGSEVISSHHKSVAPSTVNIANDAPT